MNREIFLALGLLLTLTTQLRPSGLSIGPGEICLVVYLAVLVGRGVAWLTAPLTTAFCCLVTFWTIFALALCVGTITGVMIGDKHDTVLFLHDTVAYLLAAAMSCLIVSQPDAASRLYRTVQMVVFFGAVLVTAELANAFILVIPTVDPWYWYRLRGWSDNPNELALLASALLFLSLHVVEVAAAPSARITSIGCAALFLYVGWLTSSGTFRIAVLFGIPIVLAVKSWAWSRTSGPRLPFRAGFALLTIATLPLFLASAAPMASLISLQASDLGKESSLEEEQTAELRFVLWAEAVERGMQARMLGLGPGPHLPVPLSAMRSYQRPDKPSTSMPELNDTLNFESHNTFLELFTQGGLLASSVLVWLMATAIVTAYKAGRASLTALICSLCVFAVSHDILRSPIVWFSIVYCLVAKAERRAVAAAQYARLQQM